MLSHPRKSRQGKFSSFWKAALPQYKDQCRQALGKAKPPQMPPRTSKKHALCCLVLGSTSSARQELRDAPSRPERVKQALVFGNQGFLELPADLLQPKPQGRGIIGVAGGSSSRGEDQHRRFPGGKTHGAADDSASKGMGGSSLGTFTRSQDHRPLRTFPGCWCVETQTRLGR